MIVVCDSSPLVTLGRSGRLEVLRQIFEKIHVAREVFDEVVVLGKGKPASEAVGAATWIEVHPAAPGAVLGLLRQQRSLGAGELATVLLAQALAADLALIDERSARKFAHERNVAVMGCIGVLEVAHRRGFVSDLRAAYDDVLKAEIRIERVLLNASLASFGLPPIEWVGSWNMNLFYQSFAATQTRWRSPRRMRRFETGIDEAMTRSSKLFCAKMSAHFSRRGCTMLADRRSYRGIPPARTRTAH